MDNLLREYGFSAAVAGPPSPTAQHKQSLKM
jgi:hypothetical protein